MFSSLCVLFCCYCLCHLIFSSLLVSSPFFLFFLLSCLCSLVKAEINAAVFVRPAQTPGIAATGPLFGHRLALPAPVLEPEFNGIACAWLAEFVNHVTFRRHDAALATSPPQLPNDYSSPTPPVKGFSVLTSRLRCRQQVTSPSARSPGRSRRPGRSPSSDGRRPLRSDGRGRLGRSRDRRPRATNS